MEALLLKCIEKSLHQFSFKNAIFLCERLCAEFPSEANLQVLARCYLNNNQPYSAYHILKDAQMAQSRYLFAISCFQMDILLEAESALLLPAESPGDVEVANGAAGHYLLGLIYRYTDRRENSVEQLKKALVIDPLFWAAYEELCTLGAAEEAANVFNEAAVSCVRVYHLGHEASYLQKVIDDQNSCCARTFVLEDMNLRHLKCVEDNSLKDFSGNCHEADTLAGSAGGGPSNVSQCNTPSPMPTQLSDIPPPPILRNVKPNPSSLAGKSSLRTTTRAPQRKHVAEGKSRKVCGRLFSGSGPRRSPRLAAMRTKLNASQETVGDASSLHTETSSSASSLGDERLPECEITSRKLSSSTLSAILDTLSLLRLLGEGYRLSCIYRCQDALDSYRRLSQKQYNTSWVLSQVGKAYFELVDYLNADYAFSLAHRISPYNLEGMDVYSTVLYHLKEEMKLRQLAQELISIDRLAVQSWCAVGNCYGLQKDHTTAIKKFWRAVQLNSRFAYAYTLLGHEYAALEEYENGVTCYQSALGVDPRHYNAWYGLGIIYLHQEKFKFAEHHFQKAFLVNPRSSVILCYIGITLHALKRNEKALEMIEKAIVMDKKNPLPLYEKAKILVSLENFEKALEVLEELKEYAPCESSIYAMMGQIYGRCKMHDKAILHFGTALDLNPHASDVATIKAAIEELLILSEIDNL